MLKAIRENCLPPFLIDLIDLAGKDVHTVTDRILHNDVIWTRDPENIKALFSTQAREFELPVARRENMRAAFGESLFTKIGDGWKYSHDLIRPQFARPQIANLDIIERHMQRLMKLLKENEHGWTEEVDLLPLFTNLTFDSMTEFFLGESVDSQTFHDPDPEHIKPQDRPDPAKFVKDFAQTLRWIVNRVWLGRGYWILTSWSFINHCKGIRSFVDWYVDAALKRDQKSKEFNDCSTSRRFILLNELARECRNPVVLRNEVLALFAAGRRPTTALIVWMIGFLARHPSIFDELRRTILADFGTYNNPKEITFESLKACQYLNNCINETFRIASILPLNLRGAVQDTTLPTGGGPDRTQPIFVPKGHIVVINYHAMQHRADIWGDDVEEFNPDRFQGRKFSWEFLPFGAGPRNCLGRE
ncbi:hypothetical protein MMC07_004823 [Pseudocyphellaria aurata]|nr:hypothetical protein [Pseudocyphellaria aurata]